ncbi:MAG: glutamine-hydrolyzing carbamoyl-phosphate synthase small subunit [Methylococcaceae bacterium]|nr:glutamine-hydrolyzing carbamoyl-phosphate synthase small subunit [Methylococcaceae bacterium]MDZ4156133.1 glutamine-hydrolyzing carbamoyl-phosphate synthase small subunit [Methylococcales bacterium]MDP2393712.1 glutamine-hydrolyzing carbamoyl-phosphate synthase small subunit [Methylococcaceae bacterium]MDP3019738.1 glutamine-hydrolyzing carbamoyl-phosphate synthase small subunit [Methylococcaceae bacterium]MDP3390206.1 glutamine-hydrolyzing carbamoyl-phosphate synthase small subunit [Methylo
MSNSALLVLEDGTVFNGVSIGADGLSVGEVVFNTAMTGYQEILSDPSYARQIVTLTYPHVGNTGTNDEDNESVGVFASGLVIRDLPLLASNWRSEKTLQQYLLDNNVVAIADIDTRKLTRLLRDKGAQRGCILAGEYLDLEGAKAAIDGFSGLKGLDLAKEVTTSEAYEWTESTWDLITGHTQAAEVTKHVVAYDFGVKRNILRLLVNRGCKVTVVPATTSAETVLALNPDGVFLSNGPGDPEPCTYAIEAIKTILEKKLPVFGICLGHQLLALASGAKTEKMKFGHHGANHPVQEIATGRVMISSQNHGFAANEASLPGNVIATHRSLFDGSLQGLRRTDCPAFSFQGHPEASPGPHDVESLFDEFIEMMNNAKKH